MVIESAPDEKAKLSTICMSSSKADRLAFVAAANSSVPR
jgi:hypothetical protein